jgi:hypothetical protein
MIEFGTRKRYQSAREILQDLTGQSPATSIQTPATPRYSPTPATPVIQTPPPPKVAANIALKSARGVNYSRLQQLLAAGKWQEADEETTKVMLQVAGRESEGWFYLEDIKNFPCEDLRTINQLWLDYSNGKFGFSVQKEIYESLGGTREYNAQVWEKFGDRIGWIKRGIWMWEKGDLICGERSSYSRYLTFNMQAPKAHLPSAVLREESSGSFRLFISRAKTCNL